jgi:rSAM/selenodomain-associated transferase 1
VPNEKCILGIFAKQPIRGQAKTRLAHATSTEWAERVASAFLGDTLDRFSTVPANCVVVYAPASGGDYFSATAQQRYETMPQCDGDLGQRLGAFFRDARSRGFQCVVAIGTDSPTLPVAYVEQAIQLLPTHDFVIGPASDGGYYLIGTSCDECSIFDEIPWSTSRVLESTIARIRDASTTVALLPPWYDVDTVDDWNLLRGHVLGLRRSGVDPGVPRVERLIQEESACRTD